LDGCYIGDIIGNKRKLALCIILVIIILIPISISLLTKSAVALLFIVLFAIVKGLINANYMIVVLNRFDKLQIFSVLAITQNISMTLF
ncbi:MFS transporter, partial [Francisella tularensis subsp. holarctica]|nr:MFS transporter [Francisella tularensis subsp. holarctica]